MTDKELFKEIARMWVDNGGDSEGLLFSVDALRRAIEEEENARHYD